MAVTISVSVRPIGFSDFQCENWLWADAPCRWKKHATIKFQTVPLSSLEDAGSLKSDQIVGTWLNRIKTGHLVPPLVVSKTQHGTYYVHDGNHRLAALRQLFEKPEEVPIRVACVVPRPGYEFRFHRFGDHCTYILEPLRRTSALRSSVALPRGLSSLGGRTLVLAAHPDDETGGCAGLLQRMRDPMVFFATEGAPLDKYFWRRYGSSSRYSKVRRHEAGAALSKIGVKTFGFLGDWIENGNQLKDQELFRFLELAFNAASEIVRRLAPDAIIVPAYEGGHPDHDSCSILGYMLGRIFSLPVWEMPLYHRSNAGELVCREFRNPRGSEVALQLTPTERNNRIVMLNSYASQTNVTDFISTYVEYFRPQVEYDYSKPPHLGLVNYQVWQWPISPEEICTAFLHVLNNFGLNRMFEQGEYPCSMELR